MDAGLEALVRGGPDAVRVEVLAAGLGVTKGSFYGYFDGRPALLGEMLDEWERRCTRQIIAMVEAEGGGGADKIRRVGQLTFSDDLQGIDLAVRAWARHDPEVAQRLRGIDQERMDFLRRMFASFISDPDEVEARSTLMFALAIGRHFILADQTAPTTRRAIRLAAEYVLRPGRLPGAPG